MALRDKSKDSPRQEARPARQPDYRCRKGDCTVAVWEDVSPAGKVYTYRVQREYRDGRQRIQFSDSFEHEHMQDLLEALKQAFADVSSEIQITLKDVSDDAYSNLQKPY